MVDERKDLLVSATGFQVINPEGFYFKGQIRSGKLALFCEHWRSVFMEDGHIKDVECLLCMTI